MADIPTPHPPRDALEAYGLGKLPLGDAVTVEQHVSGCETCRHVLEASPEDDFVTLLRRHSPKASAPRLHAGYEILEEIGRGGMAVVHRARQPGVGRVVALKRMLAGAAAGPDELARFRREAKLAASLRHPNLVQVHDYGEQDGLPYLVMEYVEGGTLAGRLAETPLSPGESAALVAALADAVNHAHQAGVIHRDLKPGNVLLAAGGLADEAAKPPAAYTPKIADFGLARRLDATLHTQAGALVGTPSYMAPEQALGDPAAIGRPADVYALGAILYECLTGRPPFRAATAMETLVQVRTLDPVPPRRLQPNVPGDLETICLKCLHKDPPRRYAGAGDVAADLRHFLAGEPIRARPVGLLERLWKWARRRPATASLVVAGAVTAAGLLAGAAWHQHALREQVERANANEAEARRQKSLVLANFARHHETLDAIYTRLEEDTFRVEDERARALRAEVAEATLRYYSEVLRQEDDPDPELRLVRGQVRVYAGRIHHLLGDVPAARTDLDEADRVLGALAAEFPDNEEFLREWAYCHYRRASLHSGTTEAAEAKAGFSRVVGMVAPLVEAHPASAKGRRLLGLAHHQLAGLYLVGGQNREAVRHARAAVSCWDRLLAEEPGNNDYRMRLVLSLRWLWIGSLNDNQKETLPAVLRQAEAAARPFRESPPRHLNDLLGLFALGEMYRFSGTQRHLAGDHQKALQELSEGVAVLERVLRREPGHRESRLAMSGLHFSRAAALERLGRKAEAIRAWDLAVEYAATDVRDRRHEHGVRVMRARALHRLGETGRAVAEARKLAGEPTLLAEDLRELAYVFSLALEGAGGDRALSEADLAAGALSCLRRCRAEGYFKDVRRVQEVRTAPELAALRSRPEYRRFLDELTGRP